MFKLSKSIALDVARLSISPLPSETLGACSGYSNAAILPDERLTFQEWFSYMVPLEIKLSIK
ncbi:MAG: hypothetical protein M9948_03235 [Lentimicrobium sp.]|nr:hypothetical protein [Lentimicrobium sp.]